MPKTVILILFLFLRTHILAQPDQIIFDHYGLEAGFNSREALNIVTTPNGMVWISSSEGLARFDSKRFKFYQHKQGDAQTLTHNYCKAMAVDKRGFIWVQTDDDLDVFNPQTEKFTHLKVTEANQQKRPVYPLTFRYDSISDIMWIGTKKGLYCSKQGSLVLQHASLFTNDTTLHSKIINTITNDGINVLWITAAYHIIKLNTLNGHTEKYDLPERLNGIFNERSIFEFHSSFLDKRNTLWLGTWLRGLVEFNTITKTFKQYFYNDYTKESVSISSIVQTDEPEQENVLWLSSQDYGLACFNINTHQFTSFNTKLANDPYGVKGNTYGLYSEAGKGLWIGSETGLHRYDYRKQLFKRINLSNIKNVSTLPPLSSMAIQKNSHGSDDILWFYIPYVGGYQYSFSNYKIMPLPASIATYINLPTEFLGFYIDSQNILWISSVQYGLIGYDIEKDKIIFKNEKLFNGTGKWIRSLFEDSKNRLWIGSYDGLYVMDKKLYNITAVAAANDLLNKNGLAQTIEDITEDENSNIWFTADGTDKRIACIGKLNPEKNSVDIIYNEKNEQQISRNPVGLRSIVYNGKGKVFVSFYGEGVAWFFSNGLPEQPHYLTLDSGLNSTGIGSLLADKSGNIWCSTSFGFSCYKPEQNNFINYNYATYAMDNTLEPSMYYSKQTDYLYIAQSGGLLYFKPDNENKKNNPANLVFTEIKVLNKLYSPDGKIPENGNIIQLNHNQNTVSIEFSLLSYTNGANNTYSWMLEGWDKGWSTSNNNIATYINLKPGNYTLLVKAANSEGQWTNEPILITLKIAYPFYQTWWFLLSCILASAAFIYWLAQQRINRIKEKYQLRNKIAADLHDEIGSTLTSINILSNVSQQAMEQKPQQAREMLQQISEQSKTIQQNMSDIVWSIRPDNEKIDDLVTRMREYAAQTLEQLDITMTINATEELLAKTLPMEYRKELLLIYKEAINNIAKHAGATSVAVSLKNEQNKIWLSIADNGTWKGTSTGTGTRSMKARAATMGGTLEILFSKSGTEVLATIPIP